MPKGKNGGAMLLDADQATAAKECSVRMDYGMSWVKQMLNDTDNDTVMEHTALRERLFELREILRKPTREEIRKGTPLTVYAPTSTTTPLEQLSGGGASKRSRVSS